VPQLQVESVKCSRHGRDKLVIHVRGHGVQDRRRRQRALLIIEIDGRHLRFPADRRARSDALHPDLGWAADFAVPAWLGPRLNGNMSLLLGQSREKIQLPPFGSEGTTPQASSAAEIARTAAAAHRASRANGRARVERRPLRERARREERTSRQEEERTARLRANDMLRLQALNTKLRRQLEHARELVRKEREERERAQKTASVLAGKVAKIHGEYLKMRAARDELQQRHDRLSAELAHRHNGVAEPVDSASVERSALALAEPSPEARQRSWHRSRRIIRRRRARA
jgi:hypothetical protein